MFGLQKSSKKSDSQDINLNSNFHSTILKAIAALTIVALLLPIASFIGIFSSVNLILFKKFETEIHKDPLEEQLKSANRNNGIKSGDNIAYLKNIYEKLEKNTSTIEEARLATNLNLIFAEFDQDAQAINQTLEPKRIDNQVEKPLLNFNRATRIIDMDLASIGNSAYVIISNRPVILHIKNQPEYSIGKLGVENKLPFDVINFNGPILAGFRVEAFNFYKAISPSYLVDRDENRGLNSKLCSAMKDWKEFFDVSNENIKIWHAINPIGLELKETHIKSNYVKPIRQKNYKKLCLK